MDVDDVPLVPVIPVLLQDVPNALSVGIDTSGLVTGSDILGVGMLNIGLTPKLLSSEDPSGIPTGVPRLVDVVPDVVPVVVDSIPVVLDVLDVSELQVPNAVEAVKLVDDVPLVDVVPFMPPPSKVFPATVELDVVALGATTLVHPVPLVPPMEVPMLPMELDVGEMDVVKPPGSSSMAPRGIPTGFAPTGLRGEPTAERGEVIPVAGIVVLTCAKLGSPDNTAIAMAISNLNDATLCSLCMGQPSVRVSRLRHRRQRRIIVTAIAYAARPRF
ncbi:hypothetical protein NKH52_15905 [Mesorhizobium sp. M1066]|uniref:hypothetical protein n=1 Tax=unclassified Mesorhizobium TaxID=325217 RepID=UPI0033385E84